MVRRKCPIARAIQATKALVSTAEAATDGKSFAVSVGTPDASIFRSKAVFGRAAQAG
jgi:hypothetical protein